MNSLEQVMRKNYALRNEWKEQFAHNSPLVEEKCAAAYFDKIQNKIARQRKFISSDEQLAYLQENVFEWSMHKRYAIDTKNECLRLAKWFEKTVPDYVMYCPFDKWVPLMKNFNVDTDYLSKMFKIFFKNVGELVDEKLQETESGKRREVKFKLWTDGLAYVIHLKFSESFKERKARVRLEWKNCAKLNKERIIGFVAIGISNLFRRTIEDLCQNPLGDLPPKKQTFSIENDLNGAIQKIKEICGNELPEPLNRWDEQRRSLKIQVDENYFKAIFRKLFKESAERAKEILRDEIAISSLSSNKVTFISFVYKKKIF